MKKTRYYKINEIASQSDDLIKAASILRWGGTVAFPTETVYGLGANALNPVAVAKIFAAKGRPADNPLIVHIANLSDLAGLASQIPANAFPLINVFWPGPLTLIFPRSEAVSDLVTAGLDTVAVRMPNHEIALTLIEKARVPIVAPSANLSGKPSPTSGVDVLRDLVGKVDVVIDGGFCEIGVESTVLDLTVNPPMILRPGGISKEELEEVIGEVQLDPNLIAESDQQQFQPKSPGMKYRHYAPQAEVTVVLGLHGKGLKELNRLVVQSQKQGKRVGLLLTKETGQAYRTRFLEPDYLGVLGSSQNLEQIANHLFRALRNCDYHHLDLVYAEGVAEQGLGLAIMNRLTKAAGNKIIRV